MAVTYVVLFGRKPEVSSDSKLHAKPKASCEILSELKSCYYSEIKSNAGTVAEAQELAAAAYPEHCTDIPQVVVATELKES